MQKNFQKQKSSKKRWVIIALSLIAIIGVGLILQHVVYATGSNKKLTAAAKQNLPAMTAKKLAQYDGSDPKKPIYLAFEGYVYDVTAGKEFYQVGGTYHWLAGKDSTTDLYIAGGDIIKRKYPIIARLTQ